MDSVNISLPCGFSVKYKDIFYNNKEFPCPVCKTHYLTAQECLNMTRNRMVIAQKSFELKKKQYKYFITELSAFYDYKSHSEYYIDFTYNQFKNEIDVRREEIKVLLNKKIDNYYDELLKKVDKEKESNLKEFNEKIKDLDHTTKQIESLKIDDILCVHTKLNLYNNSKKILGNGMTLAIKMKDLLSQTKIGLTDGIEDIEIKSLFGELYLKEETNFIFNQNEIDDDSRAEATIQLVINDFSKLKNGKNASINSKHCTIRNFQWSINLKLNDDVNKKSCFGFFLYCYNIDKSHKFPVDADFKLSLLDRFDTKKDLTRSIKYLYDRETGYGYPSFVEVDKILDQKNGYYDAKNDSITLKATIKAEIIHKI
ncbi:Ubiquitin carboxyl-terminal hydrolase 7 [Brachionus plicatilis]|uniref:Ubiquitin carboxyl-terminal hydrolase 7 n=1 Tax=Brachionus plicatilis TaxID=10195 RepID=A0A3M7R8A4_BRAPC|nr:Ubiquitin carboxyl-terminal hydrolase 7 [Brachionus plicatilis]